MCGLIAAFLSQVPVGTADILQPWFTNETRHQVNRLEEVKCQETACVSKSLLGSTSLALLVPASAAQINQRFTMRTCKVLVDNIRLEKLPL